MTTPSNEEGQPVTSPENGPDEVVDAVETEGAAAEATETEATETEVADVDYTIGDAADFEADGLGLRLQSRLGDFYPSEGTVLECVDGFAALMPLLGCGSTAPPRARRAASRAASSARRALFCSRSRRFSGISGPSTSQEEWPRSDRRNRRHSQGRVKLPVRAARQ